jgi:hypothetical protein
MGQQEIATGSSVRHMILVVVVAALMAAMVAATAAPAFAQGPSRSTCIKVEEKHGKLPPPCPIPVPEP